MSTLPTSLDELLPAAKAEANAKGELRRMRRLARLLPADSDAGREASAIARALMARIEWREVAIVALMLEQVCGHCGRVHFWFEGEYLERQHIQDPTARWQELCSCPPLHPDLPRRIEYRTHKVQMCPTCVREHGYA